MEIVYRASDIVEAHIVAGMLQSAGVQAYVSGHFLQGAVGEVSTMGFANVLAAEPDLELARQLVDEYRDKSAFTSDLSDISDSFDEPAAAPGKPRYQPG